MPSQLIAKARGDPDHIRLWTLKTVNMQRKVQRLLDAPDFLMLVGRQNLYGIAYGHPADGHSGSGRKMRPQVDDAVDPDLCASTKSRTVKDRSAGRDEHLVLD